VLARVIDASARVGCRLPVAVVRPLAVLGGHLEWALRPRKRRVLRTNLAHASGRRPSSRTVRRLVRHEVVNEARRSADLLWAIGRPDAFLRTVEIVGQEHADAAAKRGRGIVLAGVHAGGWEIAVAVPASVLAVPTTVIVADNWLAWAMQHVRAGAGLRVLYRTAPALAAARVLQRGESLLVFGDDAWGDRPRLARVRFCDAEALLPAGVVTLARLTGAAILPFSVLPVGPRRWQVTIEPPLDPPPPTSGADGEHRVLQSLADRWTALLQAHPDHWAASFPIAWVDSS
jgi:lauroyl/myristoyl acyltransferase